MTSGRNEKEFTKVFNICDILVIAFGAMIGWGWVVSAGDWIRTGGVLGAVLGFAAGGIAIFFVGLACAELMTALPRCGGPHIFSLRAMGPGGSFLCTWAIILGYVSAVCFEACAVPTIITYVWPGFLKGYLYTAAGFDIYATWIITAVGLAAVITYINIRGAEMAAMLQTVLTVVIGAVGILLAAMSKVLIIGGLCGIITSWNAFLIGGSRAMYSMAGSGMLPPVFSVLHKRYRTPSAALWMIGVLSMIAPFFERQMISWVINAGNFGCCIAYCMVSLSFVILRKKEPELDRPYKVKHYRLVGIGAVAMAGFMALMYLVPDSGNTLSGPERIIAGGWFLLGIVLAGASRAAGRRREKDGR